MGESEDWLESLITICVYIGLIYGAYCLYGWYRRYAGCNKYEKFINAYAYTDGEGPHTWMSQFRIRGQHQAPINIVSLSVICVTCETPLCHSAIYNQVPLEMRMVNDGHSVAVFSTWEDGARPTLSGGPLCEEFKFFNLRFRWGLNENEGSEHLIDMKGFAMEVQVTFNKFSCKCTDMSKSTKSCAVVIISYLFELTQVDNPYLESVILGLRYITMPCVTYHMRPTPLSIIAPAFCRNYFSYCGSLSFPPCTEGVRWIVQAEPLSISLTQLLEFKNLHTHDNFMFTNRRPVQNLNGRDVLFYE